MPSSQLSLAAMDFAESFFCTPAARPTMQNATGSTHTDASAMRQLNINSESAISVVDIIAPMSGQIWCDWLVSSTAQSFMIAEVRSARSFFPKNESGILRSFSARPILRTPVSIYVARNVLLY